MTRSRVSGSRLSSARPLSTRDTVDAWTFAARATSVIVTRLAANRSPSGGNRLFPFDYTLGSRYRMRDPLNSLGPDLITTTRGSPCAAGRARARRYVAERR